jgi:aryl-alcohol dehydrogenase-like predicted oxidoreductase
MAQVAMAWVLHNPVVDAPIVGATKPHRLTDAVVALDLELTDEEIARWSSRTRPGSPPTSDQRSTNVARSAAPSLRPPR